MKSSVNTSVVINIVRTLTMTILSFVTFPYVCRVLGDSALGAYSWASSFVYYFFILARISIPNIAVREVVKVKNDPVKLNKKVQELFIIQAVMTLLSFALMTLLVFVIPAFKENAGYSYNYTSLVFILSLNFLAGVLSFEWLFTAYEKHLYMSVRSIIIFMLTDILIFLFIKNPSHVTLYAFFSIAGTILIVISNLIYLPKIFKFQKVGKLDFKQYFNILGVLFVISLLAAIYDKTDAFILGIIDTSKASVGSYSVGVKGVEIVIGVMTALSVVFIPRATYYYEKKDEKQYFNLNRYAVNIALFITIPAIATMTALATPITSLISGNYDGGYKDANITLIALCSLMLTYSISYIIYTQILVPQKKEKIYMYAIGGGALLNIGFSLLFGLVIFKNNPSFGVAIGTSITDLLVLVLMMAMTWKDSKKLIFNQNTLKIASFGLVIFAITYFLGPVFYNVLKNSLNQEAAYMLEIIIVLLIDAVVYVIGLFIIKEKLLISTINRYRHRK